MIVLPNKDKQIFELNDNKTINSPATTALSFKTHPHTMPAHRWGHAFSMGEEVI